MDLCELENAPETQKYPKTFVHEKKNTHTKNVGLIVIVGGEGGGGGYEETKFMAQNVTLTRNVTTSEEK